MKLSITRLRGGLLFFFTSLVVVLSSCSQKLHFVRSTIVPAAEGMVKVKHDKNDNYSLSVNVVNLAEPDRLEPPRKTYVVWLETDQSRSRNIGQLKTSSGLFSSTLKASLNTVSSYKPERVYITAENEGDISYPSGPTVLSTR